MTEPDPTRNPMSHSPGPWQVIDPARAVHKWIVADAPGGSIADCSPPGPWMSDETATANARLIAAAPDLCDALAELLARWDAVINAPTSDAEMTEMRRSVDAARQARAALLKAGAADVR